MNQCLYVTSKKQIHDEIKNDHINPYMPNGISNLYQMDESIQI